MACNCTADLRADIIKRFFGVEARRTEFAQELIRIVECQQTMMSRDLQEWFRIWFRFSDVMFEEFLACVMKRQTTMSKELQQVIRSRYFPTSQQMANDFIRVVLCSCCPTMCGTDVNIIGISDSFTAGFVASLLQGKSISEAHATAVEVSAYVCTQKGAMPVLPESITGKG